MWVVGSQALRLFWPVAWKTNTSWRSLASIIGKQKLIFKVPSILVEMGAIWSICLAVRFSTCFCQQTKVKFVATFTQSHTGQRKLDTPDWDPQSQILGASGTYVDVPQQARDLHAPNRRLHYHLCLVVGLLPTRSCLFGMNHRVPHGQWWASFHDGNRTPDPCATRTCIDVSCMQPLQSKLHCHTCLSLMFGGQNHREQSNLHSPKKFRVTRLSRQHLGPRVPWLPLLKKPGMEARWSMNFLHLFYSQGTCPMNTQGLTAKMFFKREYI